MEDIYLKQALAKVDDPNILINFVSKRVKQLRNGATPLVETLEKLQLEDMALREIIEDKLEPEFFNN